MKIEPDIPVQDWALPGEPFRLVAVAVDAADWARLLPEAARAKTELFSTAEARARAGASEWLKACWLPRELGLARVDEAGKLAFGEPLEAWAKDSKLILSRELRHSILKITPGMAREAAPAVEQD